MVEHGDAHEGDGEDVKLRAYHGNIRLALCGAAEPYAHENAEDEKDAE